MSRPTTLLITGLTMKYTKTLNPATDTVAFGKLLDDSIATLKTVKNFYYHRFELDPSTPADHPESVESLKRVMQKGPASVPHGENVGEGWDAHIIGMGVYKVPQLTGMLEEIVNSIITSSGGKSKLLLLRRGNDHLECVKRGFPEIEVGDS